MAGVEYSPRIVDAEIEYLLSRVPAVVIEGARGCGKTMTGLNFAHSFTFLDSPEVELAASTDLSVLLDGEPPRLLDEWQLYPSLWNMVRRRIDFGQQMGAFILTGSAVPRDDIRRHSGAGRFVHLRQRTMTWYEKNVMLSARSQKYEKQGVHEKGELTSDAGSFGSTMRAQPGSEEANNEFGGVSLRALFEGAPISPKVEHSPIQGVINQLLTPGFPNMVAMDLDARRTLLRGYISDISEIDIQRIADVRHGPHVIRALLTSLSRHVSTSASFETIRKDLRTADIEISVKTVQRFIELLERMYVIEQVPAVRSQLRSRATLRKSAKYILADPALAAVALRADEKRLLCDMETTGFLFESAVIHDLAVFAQGLGGKVGYYRDSNNHEIDCVVELDNGEWAAIEAKLGLNQIAYGADRLSKAVKQFDRQPPAFKAVITGNGPTLRLDDGTLTFPLHALQP